MTVKGERSYEFIQGQVSCDINLEQEKINGLFCDEKGYVITNATLFLEEDIKILIKDDVAKILENELSKYSTAGNDLPIFCLYDDGYPRTYR